MAIIYDEILTHTQHSLLYPWLLLRCFPDVSPLPCRCSWIQSRGPWSSVMAIL